MAMVYEKGRCRDEAFFGFIAKSKLATMIECQQRKSAEHPALVNSSHQNIRDFVRNRGVTLKKKAFNDRLLVKLCCAVMCLLLSEAVKVLVATADCSLHCFSI